MPVNTCIDEKYQLGPMHNRSSVTYLDHDHCEGKNVRFLAIWPPLQDLWCCPSHGAAMMRRGGPHRIRVFSNRGEPKVRDARTTAVVHEDVWLAGCQCGGEMRFTTLTYPLEVPMNHVA